MKLPSRRDLPSCQYACSGHRNDRDSFRLGEIFSLGAGQEMTEQILNSRSMLEPYTLGSIGAVKNDNSGLARLEINVGASKGRQRRHHTLYSYKETTCVIFDSYWLEFCGWVADIDKYNHMNSDLEWPINLSLQVGLWQQSVIFRKYI